MPPVKHDPAELVVLSLLSEGALYGYAISRRAEVRSDGGVNLTPGVLYPLLKRLETQGLVLTDWDEVKSDRAEEEAPGRRRKWYRLSEKGRKRLAAHVAAHRAYTRMIEAFIPSAEGGA